MKEITDEQARIKGNLEKLPPTSELYKRLITKFDKQETELENVQRQTAEKVADEKKQKKDWDEELAKLQATLDLPTPALEESRKKWEAALATPVA